MLDADTTIKPLYGHKEAAEVGYNPHKPGRPSHAYHTLAVAGVRLVLDVVLEAATDTSESCRPPLWGLLGRLPRSHWPSLVRGDQDWGSEPTMGGCEQRGVDYLFKLRMTRGVRKVVEKSMDGAWEDAGQGWSGREGRLRLGGWSRSRRVILMRRRCPTAPWAWRARPPMARASCSGQSPEKARRSGSSPCW